MNRTWQFSDLEFVVQWEAFQKDHLPPPLSYASNLTTWDQLDHAMLEAREALRSRNDHSFADAMEVIAHPDIWIGVRCMDGKDRENPERSVRVLGARKRDVGYVVRQIPGETIWHSAGFVITECDAIKLADTVVAEIPDASPGNTPTLVLQRGIQHADDATDAHGGPAVFDSFEEPADNGVERFLAASEDTMGVITVSPGASIFGPRGMVVHRMLLRDLEDDGRYVIDDQTPPVATSVDNAKLIAMINARIAAVVHAIKDERA